jgi:hypothetical protein
MQFMRERRNEDRYRVKEILSVHERERKNGLEFGDRCRVGDMGEKEWRRCTDTVNVSE